jgi:hypothetical protein
MSLRCLKAAELAEQIRGSHSQLGFEVTPLIKQLTVRFRNASGESSPRNPGDVEAVPTALSLLCKAIQKRSDNGSRLGLSAKANKLRMMTVPSGLSRKHLLREQCLPPRRN